MRTPFAAFSVYRCTIKHEGISMTKICFAIVALALSAMASVAQIPIKQQRCYAQACIISSWSPVKAGDTLLAIIRPALKEHLDCEMTKPGCGTALYLVSDILENQWQPAYPTDPTSMAWFVTGAKAGIDIIGVLASFGYDGGGNTGPRGNFAFDVYFAEFPPTLGLDSSSQHKSTNSPSIFLDSGSVTATTSKTLLIAWTDNLQFAAEIGPFVMTPSDPRFQVLSDDGTLAIAAAVVVGEGPYDFMATYNGGAFWRAGLIAFRMGT
jgi:hypothetical protein